jgi:hypothetical protein
VGGPTPSASASGFSLETPQHEAKHPAGVPPLFYKGLSKLNPPPLQAAEPQPNTSHAAPPLALVRRAAGVRAGACALEGWTVEAPGLGAWAWGCWRYLTPLGGPLVWAGSRVNVACSDAPPRTPRAWKLAHLKNRFGMLAFVSTAGRLAAWASSAAPRHPCPRTRWGCARGVCEGGRGVRGVQARSNALGVGLGGGVGVRLHTPEPHLF